MKFITGPQGATLMVKGTGYMRPIPCLQTTPNS